MSTTTLSNLETSVIPLGNHRNHSRVNSEITALRVKLLWYSLTTMFYQLFDSGYLTNACLRLGHSNKYE